MIGKIAYDAAYYATCFAVGGATAVAGGVAAGCFVQIGSDAMNAVTNAFYGTEEERKQAWAEAQVKAQMEAQTEATSA